MSKIKTVSEKVISVASFGLRLYSISIELTNSDGSVSTSRIVDAFADLDKASAFFKLLYENLATPINLPYVFEDECMR